MTDLLPFVVSGIAVGAVYGLAATGLVLTYKTSGIFNFGHGAVATAAAYAFYWLHVEHSIDWKVAAVASVLVLGPVLGLGLERFGARLATQRTAFQIVGTIGLILAVQGLASVRYGTATIPVQSFLPKADDTFRVAGVVVTYEKLTITGVALASVVLLYAFFRRSRLGLAMRAVVDDPDLLAIHGTDPVRVRRAAWIIGSTFAALSGLLVTPLIGLDSILLTFLVVQAFAAAAVGAFSSIPLALAGGVLVGVAADIAKRYALDADWLAGLPPSLPFIVLLVTLLARGRRLLPPSRVHARPRQSYEAPWTVRLAGGVVLVAVLALVPVVAGDKLAFYTTGLVTALMLLSLGLLVRMSGQVSLCHAAFAAIGAVAFSQLHVEHGIPWVPALVLGGLVAVPVGAFVAIPAIRLSGLFLALATFGFGILVQQLLYRQSWMFTRFTQGRRMPRPSFAESPEGFYYVILAVVVVAGLLLLVIRGGRLGRMLRSLADSPTSAAAMGLSTNVTRVTVFCLSAFLAALAGTLLGVSRNFATGGDPFFGSYNSLILLAMLAIAPLAEPWFAFLPAIAAVIPGYVSGSNTQNWLNVLFGVSAVGVAMAGGHPPAPAGLRRLLDRLGPRPRSDRVARLPPAESPTQRAVHKDGGGLEVRELTVRFGGVVAVDGLSFRAPMAAITGLIGPNGAGKTCTFNACSGFDRRALGQVYLHGRELSRLGPAARARVGLGRTFQSVELCDSLTVAENVRLGDEAGRAGGNPLTQLLATRSSRRATDDAAAAALELCGIAALADTPAGVLSIGQRRLVELARCLAGPFDFLLLDEPSSGLDTQETRQFGAVLRRVVSERGVGILLVEHDMALVMHLCNYLYVVDFGRLIFDGTPEAVAASPTVRTAYLGGDPLAATKDEAATR